MTFANSIDRRRLPLERIWFVTLSYSAIWPAEPETWKQHPQALQKRPRPSFASGVGIPAIRKLEPQRRAAPHFHLLALMPLALRVRLEVLERVRHGERTVFAGWETMRRLAEWVAGPYLNMIDLAGSVRNALNQFDGHQTLNEYYQRGEQERSELHQDNRVLSRFKPPAGWPQSPEGPCQK